jgi:hypothetical protein
MEQRTFERQCLADLVELLEQFPFLVLNSLYVQAEIHTKKRKKKFMLKIETSSNLKLLNLLHMVLTYASFLEIHKNEPLELEW